MCVTFSCFHFAESVDELQEFSGGVSEVSHIEIHSFAGFDAVPLLVFSDSVLEDFEMTRSQVAFILLHDSVLTVGQDGYLFTVSDLVLVSLH